MKRWQLQEAKNRFSEVVDKALSEGPQQVTRHGRDTVLVISNADYDQMTNPPKKSFVEFLLSAPKVDIDFEEGRKTSRSRNFTF